MIEKLQEIEYWPNGVELQYITENRKKINEIVEHVNKIQDHLETKDLPNGVKRNLG